MMTHVSVQAETNRLKSIHAINVTHGGMEIIAMCNMIQHTVAHAYHITTHELRAPTRSRAPVALARQVAMYLTHVAYGFTLTDVGRLFSRDRTTAAHACRLIEDKRDDPAFDVSLDCLETALVAWARSRQLS
jgi:chromosomal replication initiation ATPase DnaA